MYSYDIYGWLSDIPIEGRQTDVVPMEPEGDMRPNFTGYKWLLQKYSPPPPIFFDDSERIAALWQAAHDYEIAEISGSAVGLLTLGVIQSKPKCTAVMGWIQAIWTLYYTRKAGTSEDTDYSSCGACPHSVPELMTELGL